MAEIANVIRDYSIPLGFILIILGWMLIFKDMGEKNNE